MRGKIGMETNKALVLNEWGHHFFFPFSFFCSKQICFIENQVCTVIVLDSCLLVMSSLCAFYPKMRTGGWHFEVDKKEWQRKRFVENEWQTLLGLRLAAHTRKKTLQNLPKKLASNDAEDLLCSLFLYFLSFFFSCVYVYVVCIFKNITFFNCCSSQ